jgi:hypothetical protein
MFVFFIIFTSFALLSASAGFILCVSEIFLRFRNSRIAKKTAPSEQGISIIIPLLDIKKDHVGNLFPVFASLYKGDMEIIAVARESDNIAADSLKDLLAKAKFGSLEIFKVNPPPHVVDRTFMILEGMSKAKYNLVAILDECAIPDSKHMPEIIDSVIASGMSTAYFLPSLRSKDLKSIILDSSAFSPGILHASRPRKPPHPSLTVFKKNAAEKFIQKEPLNHAFNFEAEMISRIKKELPVLRMTRSIPVSGNKPLFNSLNCRFINSWFSAFISFLISIGILCASGSFLVAPNGILMLFSALLVIPVSLISRFFLHLTDMNRPSDYFFQAFFISVIFEPFIAVFLLAKLLLFRQKVLVSTGSIIYEIRWGNVALKRGMEEDF